MFRDEIERLSKEFEAIDVSDYALIRERLERIDREFLRGLKHSSTAVYARGKKSAINKFNKDERI